MLAVSQAGADPKRGLDMEVGALDRDTATRKCFRHFSPNCGESIPMVFPDWGEITIH